MTERLKERSDFPSIFWNPATSCIEIPKTKNPTHTEQSIHRETEESYSQDWEGLWSTTPLMKGSSGGELGRWQMQHALQASTAFTSLSKGSRKASQAQLVFTDWISASTSQHTVRHFCPPCTKVAGSIFPQALQKAALEKRSFILSRACLSPVDTGVKAFFKMHTERETIFISSLSSVISGNTTELMFWL